MISKNASSVEVSIARYESGDGRTMGDIVAVEEPLEIRVAWGSRAQRTIKSVAVTMRTPGSDGAVPQDFELAAGFLFAEGIVRRREDLERCVYCGPEMRAKAGLRMHNVVRVELAENAAFDMARLERHFFTNSSCGVCGKTTIEALRTLATSPFADAFSVSAEVIHALPEFLREAQPVFDRTGGLHAAALFDTAGKIVALREDVGRHNALDKLIGGQFLAGAVPLSHYILLVSGRVSFELMQKAIMAGIPVVAAVGAPSSLAVEMAREFNVTLVGFLRNNRFNVYHGEQRIAVPVGGRA